MIYEGMRGEQSPWKPYLDILPTDYNTLMFWTQDELDQLQASAVIQKIGKDSANSLFTEKVLTPIRANPALFPNSVSLGDDHLLYLAHHMASTIMAYAFDIEKEPSAQDMDEDGFALEEEDDLLPKGMVPLADMLNADGDRNNARLFYGGTTVTMRALRPIKAGEEIFNDYGPLPRTDLLRRYGYITPAYTQYDVVEIPRQLVIDVFRAKAPDCDPTTPYDEIVSLHCTKEDLAEDLVTEKVCVIPCLALINIPRPTTDIHFKLDYLDEYDALEDGYDVFRNPEDDLFPDSLRIMLWTMDLTAIDMLSRKGSKPRRAALDPQEKDSVRFLAILCDILRARLDQYPTSLQEDEQLAQALEQSPPQNNSDLRKTMAVHVRIGEKQIRMDALIRASNAHADAMRNHIN